MAWNAVADAVLAVHALWVLGYVFGGAVGVRWRKARLAHLLLMATTVAFGLVLGYCPLTPLENSLRERAGGEAAYEAGFLAHHLERLVYWDAPQDGMTRLAAAWLLLWAAVYGVLERRRKSVADGRA